MGCVCVQKKSEKHQEILNKDFYNSIVKVHVRSSRQHEERSPQRHYTVGSPVKIHNYERSNDASLVSLVKDAPEPDIPVNTESFSKLGQAAPERRRTLMHNFDWETANHRMPLLVRANLELLGKEEDTVYVQELFESFKNFLLAEEEASLPGPLDLFWLICISYDDKYRELCETIVGKIVQRPETALSVKFLSLYDFSEEQWDLDLRSTLWMPKASLPVVMKAIKTKSSFEEILKETRAKLDVSREVTRKKIIGAKYHRFHKKSHYTLDDVERILDGYLEPIQGKIIQILKRNLPIHQFPRFAEELVAEYKRFLVMNHFTKHKLIPSWLIGYVWLIHMGFTYDYYICSLELYGGIIQFIHTNFVPPEHMHDAKEAFFNTKDFYRFMFQEYPDESIWNDPFSYCMWVSVYRVYKFVIETSTIDMNVLKLTDFFFENYNKVVEKQLFEKSPWAFSGKIGERRKVYASEYWQIRQYSPGWSDFESIEDVPEILLPQDV